MPLEWKMLYREALHEQDDEKVHEICDRARRAINERLTELAAKRIAIEEEREQLYDALRRLLIHENKLGPLS